MFFIVVVVVVYVFVRMASEPDQLVGMVYGAASAVANSTLPFESYIASSWKYMTDNYSEFTIATLFSVILHEVREKFNLATSQ